ncbi:MAG: aconitase X catalytic domain-containing protein [Humibacillus sp.]
MDDQADTVLQLTPEEQSMLDGGQGAGIAMAMRIVVGLARVHEAPRLVEIESAHIDGCLFHGQSGLDFAERLVDLGAHVRVPTTLNVGSIDLLHPGTVRDQTPEEREVSVGGRALMEAYLAMDARATWTCAPYQLDARPGLGVNVAWAESNAIAFCNSVLGARTDRYGDFLDICAAITGRAPFAGLHTDAARLGHVLVDCTAIPDRVLLGDLAGPLLGYLVGSRVGTANPVLVGMPPETTEDTLKAFGAAAASSGGVAMFHVVGVTPEAPTLEVAFGGRAPIETITFTSEDLVGARRELTTASDGRLDVVSVGTPHASIDEIASLAALLADGPEIAPGVDFFVSTGRSVWMLAQERGLAEVLDAHGIRVVTDTCTYVTSILRPQARVAMTNSGKWAHYAPGNLGVDVVMASLRECVESARAGKVVIDDDELG